MVSMTVNRKNDRRYDVWHGSISCVVLTKDTSSGTNTYSSWSYIFNDVYEFFFASSSSITEYQ